MGLVLYERKGIEADLERMGVAVHYVRRRRLERSARSCAMTAITGKSVGPIRSGLTAGRRVRFRRGDPGGVGSGAHLPARARRRRSSGQRPARQLRRGIMPPADANAVICHIRASRSWARERWASRRTNVMVCAQAILGYCRERGMNRPTPASSTTAGERRGSDRAPGTTCASSSFGRFAVPGHPRKHQNGRVNTFSSGMATVARQHPKVRCLIVGGVHRAATLRRGSTGALRRRPAWRRAFSSISVTDVPDVINALTSSMHASVRAGPFGRVSRRDVDGQAGSGDQRRRRAGADRTGTPVSGCRRASAPWPHASPMSWRGANAGGDRRAAQTWRGAIALARQVSEMSELYESFAER